MSHTIERLPLAQRLRNQVTRLRLQIRANTTGAKGLADVADELEDVAREQAAADAELRFIHDRLDQVGIPREALPHVPMADSKVMASGSYTLWGRVHELARRYDAQATVIAGVKTDIHAMGEGLADAAQDLRESLNTLGTDAETIKV